MPNAVDTERHTDQLGGSRVDGVIFYACAAAITALTGMMALMSPGLAKAVSPGQAPYPEFIAIYISAGFFFLAAVWIVTKRRSRWSLAAVVLPGIVMRLFMVPSTPIVEDDFYRYLWDGAVTASGINPYRHAPLDVMEAKGNYPEQLDVLAGEAGATMAGINHPQIRTIYPPVAQAVFALVHTVAPWSIIALRMVMIVFDVAAALILVILLRRFRLPLAFAIVYWWNPLVVKELINACHMDAIVLPLIAGALLFTIDKRPLRAVLALTLAVGVKIWPMVFIPLVLRPFLTGPKRNLKTVFVALAMVIVIGGLFFYPVYVGKLGGSSGFTKYSLLWQNNDGLFRLVLMLVAEIAAGFDKSLFMATQYTRMLIGGIYVLWLIALCVSPAEDNRSMQRRWLLAGAAAFLLSPTQFPWYFTWLLPLLVLTPNLALLTYMVTLPLYNLQYYLPAIGAGDQFYRIVVWVEHVPVWILLVVNLIYVRKKRMEDGR